VAGGSETVKEWGLGYCDVFHRLGRLGPLDATTDAARGSFLIACVKFEIVAEAP
jgi:hypothetical protein